MRYQTILLAVDIEAENEAVIDYAFSFAERAGATLNVLYACSVGITHRVSGDRFYDALRERGQRELERAVARHRSRPSMGKCFVDMNEPITAILRIATATSADLIIVSTHARHGVERLALGSVAEGVIEEAKVPVIVIKPPIEAAQAGSEEQLRAGRCAP